MDRKQRKWAILVVTGSLSGLATLLLFRSIPIAAGSATAVRSFASIAAAADQLPIADKSADCLPSSEFNNRKKHHMLSEEEITKRLIGAWTLVSWAEIRSNGDIVYPLGEDAIGQIIYSSDGHVAAQLVRKTRKKFYNEDWRKASDSESAVAWKEYFGYFGTFAIDLQKQASLTMSAVSSVF